MLATKRNVRIHALIIYLAAILVLIGLGAVFYLLGPYSHEVARQAPEVAHMRVPVLVLVRIMLLLFAGIVVLGISVVHRIVRGSAYHPKTAKQLTIAAGFAYAAAAICVIMVIYTMTQISGSITNLWFELCALILIGGASLLRLLSSLILRGSELQEDHDLTI